MEEKYWGLSIGAVVVRDGRALLVKSGGRLTIPYGHMLSEEEREEACERVVYEQTGVRIRTGRIVGIDDGDRYFVFEGCYQEGGENGGAVWLDTEEVSGREDVSDIAKLHIDAYLRGVTRVNRPF